MRKLASYFYFRWKFGVSATRWEILKRLCVCTTPISTFIINWHITETFLFYKFIVDDLSWTKSKEIFTLSTFLAANIFIYKLQIPWIKGMHWRLHINRGYRFCTFCKITIYIFFAVSFKSDAWIRPRYFHLRILYGAMKRMKNRSTRWNAVLTITVT